MCKAGITFRRWRPFEAPFLRQAGVTGPAAHYWVGARQLPGPSLPIMKVNGQHTSGEGGEGLWLQTTTEQSIAHPRQ